MAEISLTGSSAWELIGFYLCCLCGAQVLSPTVTLCKWWIPYPCLGSRMQLGSAGLEHSWCKLLFLTHHLKPLACLLGPSVATVNTHALSSLGAGRAVAASEGWLAHHHTFLPIPFRPPQLFSSAHGDQEAARGSMCVCVCLCARKLIRAACHSLAR